MSDSDTIPLQNAIPSGGVNIAEQATRTKTAPEDKFSRTQKAEDRYLRRFQIWDFEVWMPYDPSFIKPVPQRKDLDNYFYLDIRYRNEKSPPELVVSNFSRVLTDFLRYAIGGDFFKKNTKCFLVDFFARIDDLRADLEDVRDVLASNLAGEDLKQKANDMGCIDALGLHKTEEDARRYFEDVAEHFGVLLGMIEKEFEPTAQELELQLSYGHIAFDLLRYYFERNVKYYTLQKDDLIGFTLSSTCYTKDSTYFHLNGETTRWDGYKYINEENTFSIRKYDGTVELSKLTCKIMTDDVRAKLTARGNLCIDHFLVVSITSHTMGVELSSMSAPSMRNGAIHVTQTRRSLTLPRGAHDQLPAFVNGFELKSKQWKSFHVEKIDNIKFDDKAWNHLVIDDDVKSLIRGLVDVTKNVNTSQHLMSDVITGKDGGLIALLHGPPGTGKTLTAEAVAEHLKRPLYIVSSPELSTEPSNLESKLSEILKLATAWDAVVLIDEADVFLEQRSLHDLKRNALVSVALKVFEYHRGVLFLTTNRIQTFDDAFLSRFSIAIKYPELDVSARLTIWQKFFELAGCPLWGSESEEFVKVDGKEPRCYVSLSDLEVLAQKPFNGRTIKNLVRTAQALALSAKEPLSLDHIKVVVRAQEKFLTEFAQVRS